MTHCQRKGCRARLAHNNKRGFCSHHINQCHADDCEEWIRPDSKSGLCFVHRTVVKGGERIARFCVQCSCKMDRKNKSSLCGRCRAMNRQKAKKYCECGQSLEPRNKSGKCFKCLHPTAAFVTRKRKLKPDPPYTVTELAKTASALTLTPISELNGDKKPKRIARIRFACWYLAEPHFSYPHIGRVFGDRDHSTIMHGCQRAADLLESDKGFHILVNEIKSQTLARLANERKAA